MPRRGSGHRRPIGPGPLQLRVRGEELLPRSQEHAGQAVFCTFGAPTGMRECGRGRSERESRAPRSDRFKLCLQQTPRRVRVSTVSFVFWY